MTTIYEMQEISNRRSLHWHRGKKWSILEWAGALCGEAGELANVAKKILRIELGMSSRNDKWKEDDIQKLELQLREEAADVLAYLLCVCNERGIDLEEAFKEKFNYVSRQIGFTENLYDNNASHLRVQTPTNQSRRHARQTFPREERRASVDWGH